MNLSEEQIKNLLQNAQLKIESNPQMEDAIIDEIKNLNHYDQLILQSKQRAKIGLWVSLTTTACLIISLLYNLFSNPSQQANGLQNILPSLLVIMVLFMLHQLLYFSLDLEKKIKA